MKQIIEFLTAGVDAHAGSSLKRFNKAFPSPSLTTSAKIISGAADTINSRDNTGHGAPAASAQFLSPHAPSNPPTKDPLPAAILPNINRAFLPRPACLPRSSRISASKSRAIFSAAASLKKTFPSSKISFRRSLCNLLVVGIEKPAELWLIFCVLRINAIV